MTIPATVRIVDLPTGTTLSGAELLEAVQTTNGVGNSIQVSVAQIGAVSGGLPGGGVAGQFLQKTGTALSANIWGNISANVVASTGLTQAGSTTVSLSLASTAGLSVLGVGGIGSAVPAAIVGAADQVMVVNHSASFVGFGAVNLATSAAVSGVLPIANGGMGTTTGGLNTFFGGNGTSAPSFSSFPQVNVLAYGADPTGTNFSDNAIASAQAALPASGGDILFASGTYNISKAINLGGGGGSTLSPTSGIRLIGVGLSVLPGYAGYTTAPSVILNWGTTHSSPMIVVNGPLQGWGVQNIGLKGNGTATVGIQGISCEWGDVRNVSITYCQLGGIELTCWSTVASPLTEANSMHNNFENIEISIATANSAQGIYLTGNAGLTANSCYNRFSNVVLNLPTSGASTGINALYLGNCDSNHFSNIHVLGGTTGQMAVTLDYSIGSAFPTNNVFYNIDPAGNNTLTQFNQSGTPAPGTFPNTVYGLITTNGGVDPGLSGLTVYGPQSLQLGNFSTSKLGLVTAGGKTNPVAGGTTSFGFAISSVANLGLFCGSGAPTMAAATGTLYINHNAATAASRLYINTDGSTTWANFTASL